MYGKITLGNNVVTLKWIFRKAHQRRTKSGKYVRVCECYVPRSVAEKSTSKVAYKSACPECGAGIVSVQMPNGGWGHFEGKQGLGDVKHPCFNRGDRLPKKRDEITPDLFDEPN